MLDEFPNLAANVACGEARPARTRAFDAQVRPAEFKAPVLLSLPKSLGRFTVRARTSVATQLR